MSKVVKIIRTEMALFGKKSSYSKLSAPFEYETLEIFSLKNILDDFKEIVPFSVQIVQVLLSTRRREKNNVSCKKY